MSENWERACREVDELLKNNELIFNTFYKLSSLQKEDKIFQKEDGYDLHNTGRAPIRSNDIGRIQAIMAAKEDIEIARFFEDRLEIAEQFNQMDPRKISNRGFADIAKNPETQSELRLVESAKMFLEPQNFKDAIDKNLKPVVVCQMIETSIIKQMTDQISRHIAKQRAEAIEHTASQPAENPLSHKTGVLHMVQEALNEISVSDIQHRGQSSAMSL